MIGAVNNTTDTRNLALSATQTGEHYYNYNECCMHKKGFHTHYMSKMKINGKELLIRNKNPAQRQLINLASNSYMYNGVQDTSKFHDSMCFNNYDRQTRHTSYALK